MSTHKFTDRRGNDSLKQREVCRCCGSIAVHSQEYGKPTMACIRYLQGTIDKLKQDLQRAEAP